MKEEQVGFPLFCLQMKGKKRTREKGKQTEPVERHI